MVIRVAHERGIYDVIVEPGVLALLVSRTRALLPRRRLAIVTDETVAALHGAELRDGPDGLPDQLTFPSGEAHKTRDTWAALSDTLLARGFGRDSGLIALGGGVVGDVTGFVAATYLRGIPYVQAPTTLLAMLDASVGGKTGVDTPHGKNLIGAFHPPVAVVADPAVLRTLPEREYRAGLAEAVKHGLIADAAYFAWIDHHAEALLARDLEALVRLIGRSVEIKAAVVADDERESGRRAILNAGHTVAHAVEHCSAYAVLHGEAVAIGLVAEAALAERLGIAAPGTCHAVERLLHRLDLPTHPPATLAAPDLVAAMATDKKNRDSTDGRPAIRCALPESVGTMHDQDGSWTTPIPPEMLREVLGG